MFLSRVRALRRVLVLLPTAILKPILIRRVGAHMFGDATPGDRSVSSTTLADRRSREEVCGRSVAESPKVALRVCPASRGAGALGVALSWSMPRSPPPSSPPLSIVAAAAFSRIELDDRLDQPELVRSPRGGRGDRRATARYWSKSESVMTLRRAGLLLIY
jgi:hypothetical protein